MDGRSLSLREVEAQLAELNVLDGRMRDPCSTVSCFLPTRECHPFTLECEWWARLGVYVWLLPLVVLALACLLYFLRDAPTVTHENGAKESLCLYALGALFGWCACLTCALIVRMC